MFTKHEDFLQTWQHESGSTQKLLDVLTDQSLAQPVAKDHRTLGRIAWHVVTTLPEMMARTGMKFSSLNHDAPVPTSAAEIAAAYKTVCEELTAQVKNWDEKTLLTMDDMYGMQWPKGLTLRILISHQTHHRGQMTVLMRQAGLRVPGVYGPSLEEWTEFGMPAPEV
jgi:uncharacterized damage-inducible protein DinB